MSAEEPAIAEGTGGTALTHEQRRAVALEFERRQLRVVVAILPVALFSAIGVLLFRDSLIFLAIWPLSVVALGVYVNRIFRCPRCETPLRGRRALTGSCHACGVSFAPPPRPTSAT